MAFPDSNFSASNFRSKVRGLAKPQNFMISFPSAFQENETLSLLANSTSLPPRTLTEETFSIQGLEISQVGGVSYDDWTVTFKAERLHRVRNTFLRWSSIALDSATMSYGLPDEYKYDNVSVSQLSESGKEVVTNVRFVGMWPLEVGEVTLGHEEEGPEEFDVTFKYERWQMTDSQSGDFNIDIDVDAGGIMVGSDLSTDVSANIDSGFGSINLTS